MSAHALVVTRDPVKPEDRAEYDALPPDVQREDDIDRSHVTVECSGVDDSCRTWWDCSVCMDATEGMDADAAIAYEEELEETGQAHGVEHMGLHFGWATPSDDCIATALDDGGDGAREAASDYFDWRPGRYPVDFDADESVTFRPVTTSADRTIPVGTPVLAWPGVRRPGQHPLITVTRGPAWVLGSGEVVVAVDRHAGGISLDHIAVLPTGVTA